MQENGFSMQIEDAVDLTAIKDRYQVPAALESCHTAIVDGYVVEGHVPAAEVKRLLQERPQILGLAVPGMPIGSPGMEMEGVAAEAYNVMSFDAAGKVEVFASY